MVRIAPVRLTFNPKTLWFSAGDMQLRAGDAVIVSTARGNEFGHVSDAVFDMLDEDTQKLKSPQFGSNSARILNSIPFELSR